VVAPFAVDRAEAVEAAERVHAVLAADMDVGDAGAAADVDSQRRLGPPAHRWSLGLGGSFQENSAVAFFVYLGSAGVTAGLTPHTGPQSVQDASRPDDVSYRPVERTYDDFVVDYSQCRL
jgi:hypothetical protein